jgi:hypothetical protein
MTNDQMHELARVGAQARLHAIDEERGAILRAFPALRTGRTPASTNGSPAPTGRTQKGMSPAQRKAVGERMKAYWAKRRGEKAGTEGADTESASDAAPTSAKPPSKRKGMSPSARKAQGERMRAYWAARRAEKGAGQAEAGAGSSGKRKGARKSTGKNARKK